MLRTKESWIITNGLLHLFWLNRFAVSIHICCSPLILP